MPLSVLETTSPTDTVFLNIVKSSFELTEQPYPLSSVKLASIVGVPTVEGGVVSGGGVGSGGGVVVGGGVVSGGGVISGGESSGISSWEHVS